ncbi:MAG TPA: DinB family protein [Gemmatimonadales bacterium]|nr:DinB family protein [Gemmatimonadales bacterium]
MDYTSLGLAELTAGLTAIAREAQERFGGLDARRLNWRPSAARWSVAQCFEHLLIANRLVMRQAEAALDPARPRTLWQRMPLLPGVLGRMLIRSQAPGGARKYQSPPPARPASSDIPADIIPQFVAQHQELVTRLAGLDEAQAARTIMASPFLGVITYSVLDGYRLLLAHDRRHFEQARQVTLSPEFSDG